MVPVLSTLKKFISESLLDDEIREVLSSFDYLKDEKIGFDEEFSIHLWMII